MFILNKLFRLPVVFLLLAFMIMADSPVQAGESSAEVIKQYTSEDPFSFMLLEFGFIVILALIGHIVSRFYKLPNVLGELIIGIVAGNILYWIDSSPVFYMLMHMRDASDVFKSIWTSNLSVTDTVGNLYSLDQPETQAFTNRMIDVFTTNKSPVMVLIGIALWLFSNIGVFLLLFKLGLETKTEELIEAAEPLAFLVSVTGTLVPFFLGFMVGLWLLPDATASVHIFLAATLCTTSVAITSNMFVTLKKNQSREARLVVHAAFIDDVFGIFFLSFITNIVLGEAMSVFHGVGLFMYSFIVFVGIMIIGKQLVKYIPKFYEYNSTHTHIIIPIIVVVLISWLASFFNIGVIAGAFMAGVVLNNMQDRHGLIKSLISPLERVFSPVFFVFVGMQVNLKQFMVPETFWLTLALLTAAIFGKLASGLVIKQNLNKYAIGLGMIPRGEGVLVFISIGKILGLIDDSLFSVIVMIVLFSNFIAPWALKKLCAEECREEGGFVIKN